MNEHHLHLHMAGIGLCAVCGDRADGHHYGVLSCRGCNAFFRRAVTFNLQFHCRRDGCCDINRNARCACRACRLRKCIAVGMDRSAVQVRREMKDVLALDHQRKRGFCKMGDHEFELHDYSDLFFLHHHEESGQQRHFSTASPVLGSAHVLESASIRARLLGSVSVASSPLAMHQLDRLIEWYFCQRYRRQTMMCPTLEHILCIDQQQGLLLANNSATPDDLAQVNRVQMVLMFEWADQLEEFAAMEDPSDKIRLLRAFALNYLTLDNVLHTLESGFTDRIVFPNGALIRRDEMWHRFSPPSHDAGEMRAMEMMHRDSHLGMVEELIYPMAEMGVTFGEVMALRLLLFWENAEAQLRRPQNEQVVKRAADKAVQDLQSWYELHSMQTGSEGARVEALLALLPTIRKYALSLARIASFIRDFSVMPEWQFMGDLLNAQNPC